MDVLNKLPFRIGHGYDAHRLVDDRKLILGGIQIPFEKGLLGHSDADVLTHSIMDACLGALALGTIGQHFPDTDKQYKDISSILLLEKVISLINEKQYFIGNLDTIIVAEQPKIKPYTQAIQENLAQILKVNPDQISIKATTTEKMGFEGRMEGISAHAVVMLYHR